MLLGRSPTARPFLRRPSLTPPRPMSRAIRASLHPQLRQGWLPPLAPAPHTRPVTPRRHGHIEQAADLAEPHAGDSVALGHGQHGLSPDLLVEHLTVVVRP